MLKIVCLSAFFFLGQPINAADLSRTQELKLLGNICAKLADIYTVQKRINSKNNSAVNIQIAWLLTMRVVVPQVAHLALAKTYESQCSFDLSICKIIRYLPYVIRTEEMLPYKDWDRNDFDMDNDSRLYAALEAAEKTAHRIIQGPEDLAPMQRVDHFIAFSETQEFFSLNIRSIIEPTFNAALEQLPTQLRFHPFKSPATLIGFYERYLTILEFERFKFIAPYLVPLLPVAVIPKNHRPLFVNLLVHSIWPRAQYLKLSQLPDELIYLIIKIFLEE